MPFFKLLRAFGNILHAINASIKIFGYYNNFKVSTQMFGGFGATGGNNNKGGQTLNTGMGGLMNTHQETGKNEKGQDTAKIDMNLMGMPIKVDATSGENGGGINCDMMGMKINNQAEMGANGPNMNMGMSNQQQGGLGFGGGAGFGGGFGAFGKQ